MKRGKSEFWYKPGKHIHVDDKMQKYDYVLSADYGDVSFGAELTPRQMLEAGIMGGRYITDCAAEFPKEWYSPKARARMNPAGPDWSLNAYKVRASLPLDVWRENGWIYGPDVRGWIQWYFRYYCGRRLPDIDEKQIARWKSITRFRGVLRRYPDSAKTKQTLLHWAIDPEKSKV
jgi:hypothetical protein